MRFCLKKSLRMTNNDRSQKPTLSLRLRLTKKYLCLRGTQPKRAVVFMISSLIFETRISSSKAVSLGIQGLRVNSKALLMVYIVNDKKIGQKALHFHFLQIAHFSPLNYCSTDSTAKRE